MVVGHIDLHAFKNLKRCRSILLSDDERTTARLALILHHTCNSYRTVKLFPQGNDTVLACISLRHLDAKDILEEGLNIITESDSFRCSALVLIKRSISRDTNNIIRSRTS